MSFTFFFSENGFLQYNEIKNHKQSQLDLIFSDEINIFVSLSSEELVLVDIYHPILSICFEYTISNQKSIDSNYKYNFKKANYKLIN
jgi:hypothetical protein